MKKVITGKPEFDIIMLGHPKRDPIGGWPFGLGGGGPSGPWNDTKPHRLPPRLDGPLM